MFSKWFTIIELMVAILVFTIWGLSAYLLLYSAELSSEQSKNETIAANLAREQIELVTNLRDSNWIKSKIWNKLDDSMLRWEFLTWWYYSIENWYQDTEPVIIKKITIPNENASTIKNSSWLRYCIDGKGRYGHICATTDTKTWFYWYIKVSPVSTKDNDWHDITLTWAIRLESKVLSSQRRDRIVTISTLITDWKK